MWILGFSQYTPAKGGGLMSGVPQSGIFPNAHFVKLISFFEIHRHSHFAP